MAPTQRAMVRGNLWTARIIPPLLIAIMGYVTYVIVGPLSVEHLLRKHNQKGNAIAILVTYFFILFLCLSTFLRLLHITFTNPCYVPLGPAALRVRNSEKRDMRNAEKRGGIGGAEYTGADGTADADTPGMEMFYTKDIFVSEMDGKPKWCTHCANWKPDRAHHCSSSGRCVERMDHFCPWVGGPVGENNFKFFIQFLVYAALYCLHVLVVMAVYVHRQRISSTERLNPQFAVVLGLSAFFGLFTAGMALTSGELAIRNQTQVERLGAETRIHILAVIKPANFTIPPIQHQNGPILSYPELTYPLNFEAPQKSEQEQASVNVTQNDTLQPPQSSHAQQSDNSDTRSSATRDLSTGSTVVETTSRPPSHDPKQSIQPPQPQWPTPSISRRDALARRTFVILKMPAPGYNPWDLGSKLLNWESVMGYSIIDWLLPIKRSPCCDHEEAESYYQVGPMVDLLKNKYGLIGEGEIRKFGGKWREERLREEEYPSATGGWGGQQGITGAGSVEVGKEGRQNGIEMTDVGQRT